MCWPPAPIFSELNMTDAKPDYKTTLNLPETGFAMKASLATREGI